jgi:HSP20 family protein
MANITYREEPVGMAEPFRLLRDLMRWDPFREAFSSLPSMGVPTFTPRFEVKESKDAYIFKADLPGVAEKDLDITLTGNLLTVSGKREHEKRDERERYYAYERSYGEFSRSFTLPEGVDTEHVDGELKDGVLMLTLPKTPEHQPRKIAVKGGGEAAKARIEGKTAKA